jgi:hypothetical protein
MVLENSQDRLTISILDYEDGTAKNRIDRNTLLTSIELQHEGKSSIVTAPVISTHELSALAHWFELVATGKPAKPVVLQEPCLFFDCHQRILDKFRLTVRMEAEASPVWTSYYAEPFTMVFWLTYKEMLETAQSLRQLHHNFPTQA